MHCASIKIAIPTTTLLLWISLTFNPYKLMIKVVIENAHKPNGEGLPILILVVDVNQHQMYHQMLALIHDDNIFYYQ